MKVYVNPGHDLEYDSGAVNPTTGTRECDVARRIGERVKLYLEAAGCEARLLQSDNLCGWDCNRDDRPVAVCNDANEWGADVFVSIHCNACGSHAARGTEVECYSSEGNGGLLAQFIQDQLTSSIDTFDRGINEMPQLMVLKHTNMPACLVETAFIDNDDDLALLTEQEDEFARAIARGITDYECSIVG